MAPHDPTTLEKLMEDFLRLDERVKELGKQIEELRERTPR